MLAPMKLPALARCLVPVVLLASCGGPVTSQDGGTSAADVGLDAPEHDAAFGDTNASDTGACASSPTFDDVSTAVFVPSCALVGCHSPGAPDPGGDLRFDVPDARSRLVGRSSIYGAGLFLVIPGDVTGSFLWQKLTNTLPAGGLAGAPMPLADPGHWVEIPPDQLELVRCWIAGGAS